MAFLATFAFSAVIDIAGLGAARFDRRVAGWRSLNPGSVGLPFHAGAPGTAYWATLAPDVTLRRTTYPVADSLTRGHAAGDRSAETIAGMLTSRTHRTRSRPRSSSWLSD